MTLQIKAEDGRTVSITRAQFKEIDAVLDHTKKTLDLQNDYCLCTPDSSAGVGVLVGEY
jgi:hypothetical protein